MEGFHVNKHSWHFRFTKWAWWQNDYADEASWSRKAYPKDFCTYWRHFMYAIMWTLFVAAFVSFVAVGIVVILYLMITGAYNDPWTFLQAIMVIGIILAFWLAIYFSAPYIAKYILAPIWKYTFRTPLILLFKGIDRVIEFFYNKLPEKKVKPKKTKVKKEKKPGLYVTWYRAFKDQYCPMVIYDD